MFEPLNKERTFEAIAKQLREAIYSGKFKAGDKFPTERELAEMFSVSRAAVRSAILNLEHSGLLDIRKGAGGGFFVRELDFKPLRNSLKELLSLGKASVSDLTEARAILEPEASRLAAERAGKEDIEKMERSISDLEESMASGLPRRPDDFNFHVRVAQGSGNPVIIILMTALTDLIFEIVGSYVVTPQRSKDVVDQHKTILEAIKDRDPDKARILAYNHVKAMERLFEHYERDR